jgi:hypothetical protein
VQSDNAAVHKTAPFLLVAVVACIETASSAGGGPAVPGPASTLAAVKHIPLDRLPAAVEREKNAERGKLALTLLPLAGASVAADVRSDTAARIGRVSKTGRKLVFRFDRITYRVAAFRLPGGLRIGPQRIRLDPTRSSTLTVDLGTGVITRNFHWLLTATDTEYNGRHTLALGDRGRAGVASVRRLSSDRFAIHLLTLWTSPIKLSTWSVGGRTLPGGRITAGALFDGTYILDFAAYG